MRVLLDILYEHFDRLLMAGRYDIVDSYLEEANPRNWPITLSVGLLTITLMWKNKLPKRKIFFMKLHDHLLNTMPERAHNILRGLE